MDIMTNTFNIYCDESCHLLNDGHKAMAIGAIRAPVNTITEVANRIRDIKEENGITRMTEVKWTKISPSTSALYKDLINYFFDNNDLFFRVVVIPDKSSINHAKYNQTHDEWYYKMYFSMLKVMLDPSEFYSIYIDIKDTLGNEKIKHLHKILSYNMYDFNKRIVKKIQLIRSHESELMQITDILIGALTYLHRDLNTSVAKQEIIDLVKLRSGYSLRKTTLCSEKKMNILVWDGKYKNTTC